MVCRHHNQLVSTSVATVLNKQAIPVTMVLNKQELSESLEIGLDSTFEVKMQYSDREVADMHSM